MKGKQHVDFLEIISENVAGLNHVSNDTQSLQKTFIYKFLHAAINKMEFNIFWKNSKLIYMGSNSSTQIITGMVEKSGMNGKSDFDVAKKACWSLKLVEKFRDIDKQVCTTQQALTSEEIYARADTKEVATRLTTKVPLWGPEQQIIGLFGVSTEIRRYRPDEQNHLHIHAKKITTSSAKSIIGIAQILQAQQLAFAQSMYASNILESSDQLAKLISGIFNLSGLNSPQLAALEENSSLNIIPRPLAAGLFIYDTLEEKQLCENYYCQRLSNRYYLKSNDEETYLTRRELQCLTHLFFGRSAKETAAILNVSVKTVESYLEGIRPKLKCYSRSQLVELIIENNWIGLMRQVAGGSKN